MEVTALCITVLINMSLVLIEQIPRSYSQTADVGFPQVVPNRQQYLEYESIFISCEGLDGQSGWRVMRTMKGVDTICASRWAISTGPCTIKNVFLSDSGEYWCEAAERKRTNTVNITVAAAVILESPAVPVTEGENVTLHCRAKASANLPADFYKDGVCIVTGYEGNMTIVSVSKSNEGLYKCSINGVGESPQSWLRVISSSQDDTYPSNHRPYREFLLYWIVVTVLLMTMMMLLLGLLHYQINKGASRSRHPSSPRPPVSVQASISALHHGAITKLSADKEPGASSFSETSAANLLSTEENHLYYTID